VQVAEISFAPQIDILRHKIYLEYSKKKRNKLKKPAA
jgi:hypothetical protein